MRYSDEELTKVIARVKRLRNMTALALRAIRAQESEAGVKTGSSAIAERTIYDMDKALEHLMNAQMGMELIAFKVDGEVSEDVLARAYEEWKRAREE